MLTRRNVRWILILALTVSLIGACAARNPSNLNKSNPPKPGAQRPGDTSKATGTGTTATQSAAALAAGQAMFNIDNFIPAAPEALMRDVAKEGAVLVVTGAFNIDGSSIADNSLKYDQTGTPYADSDSAGEYYHTEANSICTITFHNSTDEEKSNLKNFKKSDAAYDQHQSFVITKQVDNTQNDKTIYAFVNNKYIESFGFQPNMTVENFTEGCFQKNVAVMIPKATPAVSPAVLPAAAAPAPAAAPAATQLNATKTQAPDAVTKK